jgi:hypothetical protein
MLAITPAQGAPQGRVIYLRNDLSFETEHQTQAGAASLLVNDISIEFSDDRRAVALWGLCPQETWTAGKVCAPEAQQGTLLSRAMLAPGTLTRITSPDEYWPVTHDAETGWIHMGHPAPEGSKAVRFLDNCVAVLCRGQFVGLYLRPEHR